jgi:predicted nucleic acid-binding protein
MEKGSKDKDDIVYVTTSLRIDKSLWKEFQTKCIEREVNQTNGIAEAIKNWNQTE